MANKPIKSLQLIHNGPIYDLAPLWDNIQEKPEIKNTTYSAGTGLTLNGTTFNHSNSVTPGTAKGDNDKKLTFSGTFTIPTIKYDAQGHIKEIGTTTMTMPDNPDTNTTYSAGGGISISTGNQISNTGVRSISEGSVEGTISVNTNGRTENVAVHGLESAAYKDVDFFAKKEHTHLYAGSETAGGSAIKAERLTTDAGSGTQPIYFYNGIPVATTYSLKKSVPADAKFTDTTYEDATTTTSGLMSKEDKIKLNNTNIAYGTCSTAASTVEKIVTIVDNENWQLTPGSLITVKFSQTNTASSPKLNVNNTGAKSIYYNNAVYTSNSSYAGYKNRYITYQYDGTYWVFMGWSYDGNTDTKVTQNAATTENINYPIILGYSASTSSVTNVVNKSADLIYNPNTKILTAPTFKGNLDGNATSADTALTANSANVASKIGTGTIGTANRPVYIKDGVPTIIDYTVSKSVPSDAIFKYTGGYGIDVTGSVISNTGIVTLTTGTGSTPGTVGLVINGENADATVNGLGTAAFTDASSYETPAGASEKLKEAKQYTDSKIDLLMNNPDGTMNSILELAEAIEEHRDVTDALNAAIGNKAKINHKHTVTHTPSGTISKTSVTPKGNVSSSFTGVQHTHDHTFTGTAQDHKHTFTGSKGSISIKYIPEGTISSSFTGNTIETSGSTGKTEVPTAGHVHKYTPKGSVSQPTFTGTSVNTNATTSTKTVKSVTNVGSTSNLTASVANRCLKLTFSAGSVPTVESISVADGTHIHAVTASGTVSKPTFTGTEDSVAATTNKVEVASNGHIHSVTPEGTFISTFTGKETTLTTEYTPTGTISYTSVTPSGTINGVAITPEGSVTSSFTGTAAEHTHTFTGTEATLTSGTEF